MENTYIIVIATIVLLLIITPFLFFFRRSTDLTLNDHMLTMQFPFRKEEINLLNDIESWTLQEAYFLRLGKIYSINMKLKNGKWKSVSSRFNAESFKNILIYFEANLKDRKVTDRNFGSKS